MIDTEKLSRMIIDANAVDVHDVEGGEQPFLYSSGNWGPGYVMIKGLVGRKHIIKLLSQRLAELVAELAPDIDFVAGNVTGGLVPGWVLSEFLELEFGRTVPFVYVRDTRKKGGQREQITGIANNPEISKGWKGLVVEELVNFAETTCNSAEVLRGEGYLVTHAACILSYENPEAEKKLREHTIELISLLSLPKVLHVADYCNLKPKAALRQYREFLANPLGWQKKMGLEPVVERGTK